MLHHIRPTNIMEAVNITEEITIIKVEEDAVLNVEEII